MKVTPIANPLSGEHVAGVQPPLKPDVDAGWHRRLNLFTGRTLSDTALKAEQDGRGGRLANRGQMVSPGVVSGLETQLEQGVDGAWFCHVGAGLGLAATGEDVVVPTDLHAAVNGIRVYAPSTVLLSGLPEGEDPGPGRLYAQHARRGRAAGRLHERRQRPAARGCPGAAADRGRDHRAFRRPGPLRASTRPTTPSTTGSWWTAAACSTTPGLPSCWRCHHSLRTPPPSRGGATRSPTPSLPPRPPGGRTTCCRGRESACRSGCWPSTRPGLCSSSTAFRWCGAAASPGGAAGRRTPGRGGRPVRRGAILQRPATRRQQSVPVAGAHAADGRANCRGLSAGHQPGGPGRATGVRAARRPAAQGSPRLRGDRAPA